MHTIQSICPSFSKALIFENAWKNLRKLINKQIQWRKRLVGARNDTLYHFEEWNFEGGKPGNLECNNGQKKS